MKMCGTAGIWGTRGAFLCPRTIIFGFISWMYDWIYAGLKSKKLEEEKRDEP